VPHFLPFLREVGCGVPELERQPGRCQFVRPERPRVAVRPEAPCDRMRPSSATIKLPMHPARIAELLTPYLTPCHSESVRRTDEEPASLSHSNLTDISTYIDLLLRWNSRINLTAIRNEE
jgi:hypothetical protein